MSTAHRTPIHRADYTPPPYRVDSIELRFELGDTDTLVQAHLRVQRDPEYPGDTLSLDGQDLELLAVSLDGRRLTREDYRLSDSQLLIPGVGARAQLSITTRLHPDRNTSLEGLYRSSGTFCTQCEAEGFRKITYFPDRPDVLAVYTTILIADPATCPVLLGNGNLVEQGRLDDGRHYATWHDPHPKPSYLFALVAGDLACLEDRFVTRSGRDVKLAIFVAPHHLDQCDYAMRSLKAAMRWDEQRYGCEYDLEVYNIVAVEDFNMGAMENKGLNVFNTRYVLARPDIATDADYQGIESVIAHEYFHNWTGNRVTCRDWFQLSLKEGLTVFRDQQFSADLNSRAVKRIDDVRLLRGLQFSQDAGPMAHPVRPDSYIEINNFYTVTVYNKGAEVVRMLHTLLGEAGFRAGMDRYFQCHDGQAVTCDDFVAAMENTNDRDLGQFRRWYGQAGTPRLEITGEYRPETQEYLLTVRQSCPPTPGQSHKEPLHIPLAMGLVGQSGQDLPLQLAGENTPAPDTTRVLEITDSEQRFRFVNVAEMPVPSLLRDFSAPVRLEMACSDAELAFLLAHDSDNFNRWDAGQQLAIRTLLAMVARRARGEDWQRVPDTLGMALGAVLDDAERDPALVEQILDLPSETYLGEQMTVIDVEGIHQCRQYLLRVLASQLRARLESTYQRLQGQPHALDAASMGRRVLKNRCLAYLMALADGAALERCLAQYRQADNMTDQLASLRLLAHHDVAGRAEALEDFYRRWQGESLVVDKWFSLQATSPLPGTLAEVRRLMQQPAFSLKNPNKVRSLIGAFCQANPSQFHAADGAGYGFLADQVMALDSLNPQVAARLVSPFTRWRQFDEHRQRLMRGQLERIHRLDGLSADVYEVVAKSLEG